MMRAMRHLGWLILVSILAGCGGPAYRNQPVDRFEPRSGYRFDALDPGEGNTDTNFVCLTFSGGGTRAAALAYGVLRELRATRIIGTVGNRPRSLLDEVDVISSASGGSVTAA